VKHVKDELAQLGKDYVNRDVGIVGISSNTTDDAPESLKAMAVELGLPFPVCYDESQTARLTQQPVRQTSSCSMPTNS